MKKIITLFFAVTLISFAASAQQRGYQNDNRYNNSWQYQDHSYNRNGYSTPYNSYGNQYSDRFGYDRRRRERERYNRLMWYRAHRYDQYNRRRTGLSFR